MTGRCRKMPRRKSMRNAISKLSRGIIGPQPCLFDPVHWHTPIGFGSTDEWRAERERLNGLNGDACPRHHRSDDTPSGTIGRIELSQGANEVRAKCLIESWQFSAYPPIDPTDNLETVSTMLYQRPYLFEEPLNSSSIGGRAVPDKQQVNRLDRGFASNI